MLERLTNLRPAQARLIAAIAERGQLQLAAQACQMTQPAASRTLAEVERMLNAPLFRRTPKGMEPTAIGTIVAQRAQRIVLELRDMDRDLRDLRAGRGGRVHVGAVTGPALGYVVPAIVALKEAAPRAEVSVDVAPSVILGEALRRGDLDFALARIPPEGEPADFDVAPARDEKVSLVVRAEHPLAEAHALDLADLAGLPWILQARGAPIRNAVDAGFAAIGRPTPADVVTTSSLLVIIAMLVGSDAVAAMTDEVAELIMSDKVGARFRRLDVRRPIEVEPYLLLTPRNRVLSPLALRLYALVRERLGAS